MSRGEETAGGGKQEMRSKRTAMHEMELRVNISGSKSERNFVEPGGRACRAGLVRGGGRHRARPYVITL